MKKNFIKKIALALALLLVALSMLALSSCTSSDVYDLPDGAVDWTLSDDFKTLTNETDGIEYKLYCDFPSTINVFGEVYVYYDDVEYSFTEGDYVSYSSVYRPAENKDVVWLDFGGSRYFYVTENGEKHLDALFGGDIETYRLRLEGSFNYKMSNVHEAIINRADGNLSNGVNVVQIDTRYIDNSTPYYVEAFDETDSFSYDYAVIFSENGNDYLYVKLSDLDPRALDQYGRIEYNSGIEITATRLNDDDTADIKNIIDGYEECLDPYYTFEADEFLYVYDEDSAGFVVFSLVLFWFALVAVGFVLPLPFLALGFALAFIKKLGRPKYWLAVSAFALLWMLSAALFALVIILILLI